MKLNKLYSIFLILITSSAYADENVCKGFTRVETDTDNKVQVRASISSAKYPVDPEGKFTSTKFHIARNQNLNLKEQFQKRFPALLPCFETVTQFEIITDEFIMDSKAVLDLDGKDLIIRARKATIEPHAVIKSPNVYLKQIESKNGMEVKDWAYVLNGTSAFESVLRLAAELFKENSARGIKKALEIYEWVRSVDRDFSTKMEIDMVMTSFSKNPVEDRDPVLEYEITSNPLKYRIFKEAIYYSGLIRTGYSYYGFLGDYISTDRLKEVGEACPEIKNSTEYIALTRDSLVSKSRLRKLTRNCKLPVEIQVSWAELAPAYSYEAYKEVFQENITFLKELERNKEFYQKQEKEAEFREKLEHEYARQQTSLVKTLEIQKINSSLMITRQESVKKALQDQLGSKIDIMNDYKEYRTLLQSMPTNEADSNAMRDIGGFLMSAGQGASMGAAAGPYGAIAGAFAGTISFIGNKKYEEDQKFLMEERRRIEKGLRLIQTSIEEKNLTASMTDLMHQMDQSNLSMLILGNQRDIAAIQVTDAQDKLKYHQNVIETIWNGVKPSDFYDHYIVQVSEALRRDVLLLQKTIQYTYKEQFDEEAPLYKGCISALNVDSDAESFENCRLNMGRVILNILAARGEPKIDINNPLDDRYNYDHKVLHFSPTNTPMNYKTFLEKGLVSFTLQLTDATSTDVFEIPSRHKIAEIVGSTVLYDFTPEPEMEEKCSSLSNEVRFNIERDSFEKFASQTSDDELIFNTGDYLRNEELAGITRMQLRERHWDYEDLNNLNLISILFSYNPKAFNFTDHSPIGNWVIDLVNKNVAQCIKDFKFVIYYRFLKQK